MNRLYSALITFALLTTAALGAQLPIPEQEYPADANKLVNPGFERGTYGWTASGGATKTADATAKLTGTFGYDWNSNGAAQTLLSTAYTIEPSLKGQNGLAYCRFLAASGTATHTITVNDGTNDLVTAQAITSSTSVAARTPVNFIFPSSGSVKIKIASVAADEPALYIDDCYLGLASNVQQISQAAIVGYATMTGASGCTFEENTSSGVTNWVDLGVGSSCGAWTTSGGLTAVGTNDHRMTYTNMPSGDFEFTLTGMFNTSSTLGCQFRLSDGTNVSPASMVATATAVGTSVLVFNMPYTTAPGTTTFKVQAADTGTGACRWYVDNAGLSATWIVKRFPTVSEQAFRPEHYNWRVDANISAGTNPSLSTTNDVSTYENGVLETTDATLTNNTGNGVITAQIPCSTTVTPSGTTCSSGSESLGVAFTLPAAQDVLACASFAHRMTTGSSGVIRSTFQIVETPTNAQTVSQEGKSRIPSVLAMASVGPIAHPMRVCGTFTFSSGGQKVLRLRYEQDITTTVTTNEVDIDADAEEGQNDIHWEVYPINPRVQAPILVNGLINSSSGVTSPEIGVVSCSSSSSIAGQHGSWIASIGNVSGGACVITLNSGIFSATPYCWATFNGGMGVGNGRILSLAMSSSTSITVDCADDTGAACTTYSAVVACMGAH